MQKRMQRKLLSLLLVFAMLFSSMPLGAFADDTLPAAPEQTQTTVPADEQTPAADEEAPADEQDGQEAPADPADEPTDEQTPAPIDDAPTYTANFGSKMAPFMKEIIIYDNNDQQVGTVNSTTLELQLPAGRYKYVANGLLASTKGMTGYFDVAAKEVNNYNIIVFSNVTAKFVAEAGAEYNKNGETTFKIKQTMKDSGDVNTLDFYTTAPGLTGSESFNKKKFYLAVLDFEIADYDYEFTFKPEDPNFRPEKEVYTKQLVVSGRSPKSESISANIITDSGFELTVPSDAKLSVATDWEIEPASHVTDEAAGTTTYTFKLAAMKQYFFRVSGDDYITFAGTFTTDGKIESLNISQNLLLPSGKTRKTLDRDPKSQSGSNVADMYMNINAPGYLRMDAGDQYQFVGYRNWWVSSSTWNLGGSYSLMQPDYHYTVLDLNGEPADDVVAIDEKGVITAKNNGTAIVLVTYDALSVKYSEQDSGSSYDDYDPNGFFGAIWPENTGVFVVSVGAEESDIETGMTLNSAEKPIDSEADVIYFVGEKGEYTFTPKTAGVSVSVANPTITDDVLGFSGFTPLTAGADGSFTVPLTNGRNIVKVEKDGKAEYQVITAKHTNVTVNGVPLKDAGVCLGDTVSVKFDYLFNPINRTQFYNTDAAVLYQSVSGLPGRIAGNNAGPWGFYYFPSSEAKHTVENFVIETDDGSVYHNPVVRVTDPLSVPADYKYDTFTLANGSFGGLGFGSGFGRHRQNGGFINAKANTNAGGAPSTRDMAPNITSIMGRLPDISIPIVKLTKVAVATPPEKLTYGTGESFDPAGMTLTATYSNGMTKMITDPAQFVYDTAAFGKNGKQKLAIGYTQGGVTKTADLEVTVTDVKLTAIEITTPPTKMTFVPDEAFDPAGMVITATYSDGTTEVIPAAKCSFAPQVFDNSAAKVDVTVSYGDQTAVLPDVTVKMVTGLKVVGELSQTEFSAGEKFWDPRLRVESTYSDGTSEINENFQRSPRDRGLVVSDKYFLIYPLGAAIKDLPPAAYEINVIGEQPTDYITVYTSYSDKGEPVYGKDGDLLCNVPLKVYDWDGDGKYTVPDAFISLHNEYYTYGSSGFSYNEKPVDETAGGVTSFFGNFVYSRLPINFIHNYESVMMREAISYEVQDGDTLAAYIFEDDKKDVYTWFEEAEYTAKTGERNIYEVKGRQFLSNIAGRRGEVGKDVIPSGATVTVYDAQGQKVDKLSAVVDKDGNFALRFPSAGTYTIEVSGKSDYTGFPDDAVVVPSRTTVKVTGNGGGGGGDKPAADSITVYMSYTNEGKLITSEGELLYNLPVTVHDDNKDGKYTMSEAFRAFHKEYYSGGVKGYVDDAENGWVSRFWGKPSGALSYVHNHKWVNGTLEEVRDGDSMAAFNYKDETQYADLYTWFDKTEYSASTGSAKSFTVNGLNVMKSSPGNDVTAYPAGATVTVYNSKGAKLNNLSTKVDADGRFEITFPADGEYTVEVSGLCTYTCEGYEGGASSTYPDAVVVPSRCTVNVSASGGGGGGGGTTATTKPANPTIGADNKTGFVDVKTGDWFYEAVKFAKDNGLMNGEENNRFNPNSKLNRAMLVTILYRLEKEPNADAGSFVDVAAGQWYAKAVAWASANGIVKGYEDGNFRPLANISREEFAAVLMRYAEFKKVDVTKAADLSGYKDSAKVSAWAKDNLAWANAAGLIKGDDNNNLNPQGAATRAEAATILMRLSQDVLK